MFLKSATGVEYDLSKCKSIQEYANDPKNHVSLIVDQINSGLYSPYLPKVKGGVIVDIGANIGLTTLYFKDWARKVYSVEPTPSHYSAILDMVKTFDCVNVEPINVAISNYTGHMLFHTSKSNPTNNSLVQMGSHDGESIIVMGASLSNLCTEPIDFMKVDIEGGEYEIMGQFGKIPIERLFIECHNPIEKIPALCSELEKNFEISMIDNTTVFGVHKSK